MKTFYLTIIFTFLLKPSLNNGQTECNENQDCDTEGAICTNATCICPFDHVVNSERTRCLLESTGFGEECEDNVQCSSVLKAGGQCLNGKCHCAHGFHYHLGYCYRSMGLGEVCRNNNQCFSNYDFDSTTCGKNKRCQCSEGYYLREYSSCRKISFAPGEPCGIKQDCHFPNAVCTMSRICAYTNTTLPIPWPNLESESRAEMQWIHQYRQEYFPGQRIIVGSPCTESKDCAALRFTKCSKGGRCLCLPGYYSSDNKDACYPEVGAPCTTNDNCKGRYTTCQNGTQCACKPGFVARSDNRRCLKMSRNIGWSCLQDEQCSFFGQGGHCENKKCKCMPGTHFENSHLYCWHTLGVGESCKREEDCGHEGKTCLQGRCSCLEGYHPAANNSICRKDSLHPGESCIDDSDCIFQHSTCKTDICHCLPGYYPDKTNTCVTGIGGLCSNDTECFADHSICIEGVCQCHPLDYIGNKNGSMCLEVPKEFGSFCTEDVQCEVSFGYLSACLQGTCSCTGNSHFFKHTRKQDKGHCYKDAFIGENCTRAAQCIEGYDFSSTRVECRRGICSCNFQYTYDPTFKICANEGFNGAQKQFILLVAILFSVVVHMLT